MMFSSIFHEHHSLFVITPSYVGGEVLDLVRSTSISMLTFIVIPLFDAYSLTISFTLLLCDSISTFHSGYLNFKGSFATFYHVRRYRAHLI